MSQRPIKRKNINVSGFDSEFYDTRIQYKNLNIHKHYPLKVFNIEQ